MPTVRKILKQRKTIFIVEDDKDFRQVLVASLQRHFENAGCLGFASAEDCLRTLKNIHPSLIIMDIAMPGMSGLEACKEIHAGEGLKNLPIILISGLDPQVLDKNFMEESRAKTFLQKPFTTSEIADWVEKLLD